MNAIVVPHPHAVAFRPSPRIATEIRALHADALWITLQRDPASGLQNFTPQLVRAFQGLLDDVEAGRFGMQPPHYAVVQSADPGYFSMGGDLRFFRDCIQRRDFARLRSYSMQCLDLLLGWHDKLQATTSIALVQGRALGGGFEMALGMDYLIAEEHSSFGFPEIMFGLFPCTGAMGLLSARIGARQAERMMTNKKIYSAAELYDMGLVDELCATGEGELAVERFVANHAPRLQARLKVRQSRCRQAPVDRAEGIRVVEDWVDTARRLSAEELRTMDMLIMMQAREAGAAQRNPPAA